MTIPKMQRCHAVTIRPIAGISDRDLKLIDRWASSKCRHYFIGVEKTGKERHAHIGLCFEKATSKSNLVTNMLHVLRTEEWTKDPTQVKVFRKGVKPWYNNEWPDNYVGSALLHKSEDEFVAYASTLPENLEDMNRFYLPPGDTSLRRPISVYFLRLEELYLKEHSRFFLKTTKEFEQWLLSHMCYFRDIECIPDPRKRKQTAEMLRLFVHQTGFPLDQKDCPKL